MKRCGAAVRPRPGFRAVVGAINHNGVVGDPEIVKLLQHLADHVVMLDHAVGIKTDTGAALGGFLQMRPDMHARGVEPDEKWLVILRRLRNELLLGIEDSLIHRFHPLAGERPGIFDFLAALAICPSMQHAARTEIFLKLGVLRIVIGLRFLLRVQVIKIAEELIEAMHRR